MSLAFEHPRFGTADPHPPVVVLRWPEEAERRSELAALGRPRLLVLGASTPPPLVWDELEDWVRDPADPVEVETRLRTLERRAAPDARPRPVLDTDGIIRWAGGWAAVPPVEARLLAVLLRRMGEVVPRAELVAAGWPGGDESARVLDGRVKLLRRRIAPLGLSISTVRGVGLLLDTTAE